MEKLNIAELLKDCPRGMELDCTAFEGVKFEGIIHGSLYPIEIVTKGNWTEHLTAYGCIRYGDNAKCVIFPKGKTTWEGFQKPFKDGDILISGLEDNPFIFKRINGLSNAQCYCAISCFGQLILNNDNWTCIKGCRLATEEEKSKLFQAIKDNGYRWNTETKTLEKLIEPKFKIGDKIKKKGNNDYRLTTIESINNNYYVIKTPDWFDNCYITDKLYFSNQDNYELVPSKFDINTLKPFDKVLVRCSSLEKWHIQFFEKYNTDSSTKCPFICLCYNKYSQCIPYENNQHLLDTANDCNDFYKTWE